MSRSMPWLLGVLPLWIASAAAAQVGESSAVRGEGVEAVLGIALGPSLLFRLLSCHAITQPNDLGPTII